MKTTKLAAGLLAFLVLTGAVTAAAVQGSQEDPLITLSYLTNVLTPKLEGEVSKAVAANEKALTDKLSGLIADAEKRLANQTGTAASATFTTLTLKTGERKTGLSEYLLRTGKAVSVGQLLDSTTGEIVQAESTLTANHLYVALDTVSGVKAAENATFLAK
ncbi:MAG: hypothetical protein RR949_08870 [Oscillospiraceae bacterium]